MLIIFKSKSEHSFQLKQFRSYVGNLTSHKFVLNDLFLKLITLFNKIFREIK